MNTQQEILSLNRDPELSDWFTSRLEYFIGVGLYHNQTSALAEKLIAELAGYREHWGIDSVSIGISGGIDSAVTANLFKQAGWRVLPVIMSIDQNPAEVDRGREVCEQLEVTYIERDLTEMYNFNIQNMSEYHDGLAIDTHRGKIRRGNIRARLRMQTLYDFASQIDGCVASTDNFSELAAGFWTLHGDVGDIAPIQSLTKSWEVPKLAQHLGVPQSVIDAKPTDGLGITTGDEDQLGVNYLEFDIGLFSMMKELDLSDASDSDKVKLTTISERIKHSGYKRCNPYNLMHPVDTLRYQALEELDNRLQNREQNLTL
jgi:NAD+ synthase